MNTKQAIEMTINTIRFKQYSLDTERAYLSWLKRYWAWCKNNSSLPTEDKIKTFLTDLVIHRKAAPATQDQAKNAIAFFYRNVLKEDLGDFSSYLKSKKPRRLPDVLSQEEIAMVLPRIHGVHGLIASLMYGCGLRLNECLKLRIQNIDFYRDQIFIKQGKGNKDRVLTLPNRIKVKLQAQIEYARELHNIDAGTSYAGVALPNAIGRKFTNADKEWPWFWVFPAAKYSTDPRSGVIRRHHIHDSPFQKALKRAARETDINKRVSSHILRHSYATHSLENGMNIRELQESMGHKDISTTQVYLHLARNERATASPLDLLAM